MMRRARDEARALIRRSGMAFTDEGLDQLQEAQHKKHFVFVSR